MRVLNWEELSAIAQVSFIKGMTIWLVLVPILAKIFEKVGGEVSVIFLSHEFNLLLELPFSWYLFYLCSLFFVLANIIYYWHCPDILKEHKNYGDFNAARKTTLHLSAYADHLNIDWAKMEEEIEMSQLAKEAFAKYQDVKTEDLHINEMFNYVRMVALNHKPKARSMASMFYVIGIGLLVFVALQNFLAVSSIIIRKMYA
jgi:hypothetical protein